MIRGKLAEIIVGQSLDQPTLLVSSCLTNVRYVEVTIRKARASEALRQLKSSKMASPEASQKSKHLEVPSPTSHRPRPHIATTPSHLLPATALFQGPNSHNASRNSLNYLPTPVDTKSQHLPRAHPPTKSFSASRPSLIGEQSYTRIQPGQTGGIRGAAAVKREDDFRADAVWAEMQKTLADVELSAMSSSHVFSSTHAKALEDLRSAQLGLAQAWAKSEADEMIDEEFGNVAPEQSAVGTMKQGMFGAQHGSSPINGRGGHGPSMRGSMNSTASRNLEEETERDIRLARRRREANDRYFKQVNRGVLDVVSKLDEVANAMRRVEKESREIWNDSSGSDDLGDATETDVPTGESAVDTDTDVFVDSPVKAKT